MQQIGYPAYRTNKRNKEIELTFVLPSPILSYMTRHNFYIITGGPGAGKTSVLENLALKGYSYIPETARQIIKERLSKGLPPRQDPTSFAQQIFALDWKNFALNSSIPTLLFYDRSFMDSACMLFESNMESYNKV